MYVCCTCSFVGRLYCDLKNVRFICWFVAVQTPTEITCTADVHLLRSNYRGTVNELLLYGLDTCLGLPKSPVENFTIYYTFRATLVYFVAHTLYKLYIHYIFTSLTLIFFLDKPVCKGKKKHVYGVARGEVVSINCTGTVQFNAIIQGPPNRLPRSIYSIRYIVTRTKPC